MTTLYVNITSSPSGKGHVYAISNSSNSNGTSPRATPKLNLVSGNLYRFEIDTPGHPFYITTSGVGGGNLSGNNLIGALRFPNNSGIEKGSLTWTPVKTNVRVYYQCNYHKNMGGEIIIN